MKKSLFYLFLIVFCIGMMGCSTDETDDDALILTNITAEEKEEFISEFLIEFFSFNCNDRYDTFMETMANTESNVDGNTEGIQSLPENQEKAYDDYYSGLSKYVTEDCINTMQANRLPVQLDKFVKEKGIEASVDYIELILDEADIYSYKVYFEENGDSNPYFTEPLAGQISVEVVEGQIKITSIWIAQ